ncbi:MAG TPA: GNAT family N-acetyltransferase [Chitinophagales bacterium]|nr:GNAT family N-acetyltransferase [Chitinophagales bacterium]
MPNLNLTPFPELETERLLLRPLLITDVEAMFRLRSNPRVNRYVNRPATPTMDDAIKTIERLNKNVAENKGPFWAVELKTQPGLIGTICLWNFTHNNTVCELGYEMHPDFFGRGLMAEGTARVIDYGFNVLMLEMIEAVVHKENERSIKLLQKHGFILNQNWADKNEPNVILYSLRAPV